MSPPARRRKGDNPELSADPPARKAGPGGSPRKRAAATPAKRRTSTKADASRSAAKKAAGKKPSRSTRATPARRARATPPAEPVVTEADLEVLELRRAGWDFTAIARQLHRPVEDVTEAWARAWAATSPASASQVAALELDRLERLYQPLYVKAQKGDEGAIDRVALIARTRVGVAQLVELLDRDAGAGGGPVETATAAECDELKKAGHPLAAAAVALARQVDRNPGNSTAATVAARELRMTMNNLRAVAGWSARRPEDGPEGEGNDGTVVGPSRLAALREKHSQRGPR